MEGVMMQNKDTYAVAVRKPDHEIDVKVSKRKNSKALQRKRKRKKNSQRKKRKKGLPKKRNRKMPCLEVQWYCQLS